MTRTSLILQLCSLWLLTPTIIGEEKMEKARVLINKHMKRLSSWMNSIREPAFGGTFIAASMVLTLVLTGLARLSVFWHPANSSAKAHHFASVEMKWSLLIGGSLLGLCLALIMVVGVLYSLTLALGRWLGYATRSAHAMLVCGATLFTIGIILAFIATW
jgi:hypothetical protein